MAVALAQRVVGADAETVHKTTLHAHQEAVVLLNAERGVLVRGAQVLAVGVVGHRQLASLIEVGVDRAHREELRTRGRLQRARARDVHARVERAHVPQPIRVRPDVGRRDRHVVANLTLDPQVPRLLTRRLDVRRNRDVRPGQRERRVRSRREWEEVLVAGPSPRIVETADRIGHARFGVERRRHRRVEVELRVDEVVAE